MRINQTGFSPIILIIIIGMTGVLGFTGWQLLAARENNLPQQVATEADHLSPSPTPKEAALVLILIDQATGKPVANSSVHIDSNNGTLCKRAPCPANDKSWQGTSDDQGRVLLPQEIVQYEIETSVDGYLTDYYTYTEGTKQATVQLQKI